MPAVVMEDGDEHWILIGTIFDLKNTSTNPAPAPNDPDINHMPIVVIRSNTGVLLSFVLVDNHDKSTCSNARDFGRLRLYVMK